MTTPDSAISRRPGIRLLNWAAMGLEKVALQGMSYSDRRKRSAPAVKQVVSHPKDTNCTAAKDLIVRWICCRS